MIDCTGMIWEAGNAIKFPMVNLALNGIAKQKCDYNAGSPAWNANDGEIDGPISHTGHDCTVRPWWSVDLGGIREINQVKIYNRLVDVYCPQYCQDRLQNFYLRLYETDPEGDSPIVVTEMYQGNPIGDEFTFTFNGAKARWVRIELQYDEFLHLREVEVFGRALHPNSYPFSLSSEQDIDQANQIIDTEWNADLALGKTVIASSTATAARYVKIQLTSNGILNLREVQVFGYKNGGLENLALSGSAEQSCEYNPTPTPASNAIDGKINGPVSHTCDGGQAWLRIDLGAMYEIDSITIYNRDEDCCRDRLKDFYIRFYGDDGVFVVEEIYQEGLIGASKSYPVSKVNPYFVVDGKPDTYWRSGDDGSTFLLSVDLGKLHNLDKMHISWLPESLPQKFHVFFSQSETPPVLESLASMSSIPLLATSGDTPDLYSATEIDGVAENRIDLSVPSRWVHIFSDSPVDTKRGFAMTSLEVYGTDSTTSKW